MIQGIFVITLLLFCFYGIFGRKVTAAESEGLYSTELSNQIRQISYLNDQLQAVEELIIDIETSDSHHHKNVQLAWQTSYGKNLSADVWVDGDSIVTAQALALAEERERELTAALFAEIDKLSAIRHNKYVSRTIVIHRREEDRKDV